MRLKNRLVWILNALGARFLRRCTKTNMHKYTDTCSTDSGTLCFSVYNSNCCLLGYLWTRDWSFILETLSMFWNRVLYSKLQSQNSLVFSHLGCWSYLPYMYVVYVHKLFIVSAQLLCEYILTTDFYRTI